MLDDLLEYDSGTELVDLQLRLVILCRCTAEIGDTGFIANAITGCSVFTSILAGVIASGVGLLPSSRCCSLVVEDALFIVCHLPRTSSSGRVSRTLTELNDIYILSYSNLICIDLFLRNLPIR